MKSQRTTLSVITLSLTVLVTAAGFCLPSLFGNDQAIPPTARVTSPARPRPVGERRGKLAEALSVVPVNSDNIKLQLEVNGSIVGKLAAQVLDPFAALARTAFIPRTLTTFGGQDDRVLNQELAQRRVGENSERRTPKEQRLIKAHSFDGDLRDLPYRKPRKRERPEREEPRPNPRLLPGPGAAVSNTAGPIPSAPSAPAPATTANFEGLDFANWGAGHPPDTNGDVGPTYYIQTINTSIGIYRKSDGVRVAAFTFDTFMSQGNFGNLCDTDNFGDPVILYDSFEDRWVISDFAFTLDGSGNVINPPGSFQCFAASKTGDPVTGGWNFYSINTTGGLGDYPKFGIWPDGLYMSVNMFDYAATGSFQNPRVYAFNKAQMYAGLPIVQSVSFDAPSNDFTILPGNARLQTGTPPTGTPNYFVSTWNFLNALAIYKCHVDWDRISLSTFTGPDVPIAASSWPNASVPNAPSLGGNNLDVLQIRAMMQNQYSNIGGVESLWATHTVRRQDSSGFAAPRWYQVDVTGATVAANIPQAATWDPDGANVIYRFMPSLAVDRMGNMALGYSTSSSTTKPAIKYAGRLATDPINTFSQTEQELIQGAGTQTGNCGGAPCTRWGDYSAMSLDPNGCAFWYTNEYYAVDGLNHHTRIGSFAFPQCTPVGNGGTVSGTVTDSISSNPINGATVTLGSRTTTTNASGSYTFNNLPAGVYPSITATFAGYNSSTATNIVVTDAGTTTQNFSLAIASANGCLTDTSQSDFELGVATGVDLTSSPGNVTLSDNAAADQQNTTLGNQGVGFTTTTWLAQTFTPAITGKLSRVDLNLFSLNCSAVTMPDITVSVRNASGNLPTGSDLAVGMISGFCNGGGGFFMANFASAPTLTSGTQYAIVWRAAAAIPTGSPSPGYFGTVSAGSGGTSITNPYAGGRRSSSSNSGTSWAGATGNANNDHGFIAYMQTGYTASGDLISGIKDANPAGGLAPQWTTLSWNATVPANTTLKFQAAGSNDLNGPFNFVGPDGTASTFFTANAASLSQFNSFRYLKYRALLSTTDSTVTPNLSDVTVCFTNAKPGITAVSPLSVQQSLGSINTQIATVTHPDQALNTLVVTATPLTGSGVTISNITVDALGIVTANVGANCSATNSTFTLTVTDNTLATASAVLTVNAISPATPSITPSGPTAFCTGGSVTLTSSSASGNQWFLNGNPIGGATSQTYNATASGNYTVVVTALGCPSSPSAATTVTVSPIPPTPTITPGGPTTFCSGGSVGLTSSSASGNQWFLNGNPIGGATSQTYNATASGNYTVVVTALGCPSSPSAATTVTVNPTPATPTITANGATTFCNGGNVGLTSSSASGNQWFLNGNPIGGATNQTYNATTSGNYTVVVTAAGCPSNPSTPTTVTVNPIPATPTVTANGATTFCNGGNVGLTSSSASGNQWFLNGNPIGGATSQTYNATASGNYTVVVTAAGCPSNPSAATTVTVNPIPATPTVTANGATTFCNGGNVGLTSSSASGNQWFLNGNPIGGATSQTYNATASGNYTVVVTAAGCPSSPSAPTTVTVNPAPATPTITANGATTFCNGGNVGLTSSSASGNQWFLNGNPIGGATNQTYNATTSGNYTVVVTAAGCPSNPSAATTVTVNPIPATPTITANGATTFCNGGNVGLTSSSASGNQWFLNGNPIGGATSQTYNATASGNYTVIVTANGCSSAPSASTSVTVNPAPLAPTITPNGPTTFVAGGSVTLTSSSIGGNQWYLNGNPIVGATGTTYVATGAGDYTVTSTLNGCTSPPSAAVTVTLYVPLAPTINKQFLSNRVLVSGTTLLNFAITNPNSDPNLNVTLNGITFSDNLLGGLVVATPNQLSNQCGGTVTATPGSSSISLTGGVLAPAAPVSPDLFPQVWNSNLVAGRPIERQGQAGTPALPATGPEPAKGVCVISVAVMAPNVVGVINNTTGPVASNESGPGQTSNTASLTVKAPTLPPTITKAFGASTIGLNGTTSLTFNFSNPNTGDALMNVSVGDLLPSGVVVANVSGVSGTCAGNISAVPGSSTIGIASLNLSPSTSCSVSINVTATSAGSKSNTTGNVTASSDDGNGNLVPITGGQATALLQVLKGDQAITFDVLGSKTWGDADFDVSATSSSGLPVNFAAGGNCITTVSGSVHLTGPGSCTITASQVGDSNYNAATNVAQSFNIAKADSSVSLSSSINPSDIEQGVTFTATITPTLIASRPTGMVQFMDGANPLGSAFTCVAGPGNSCVAQVSTSSLTTGTHLISADYSGDNDFAARSGLLVGGQVVTNQPALLLILEESGPDPNLVAALESVTLLRDPFPVPRFETWFNFGVDTNTRMMVFVANLQLNQGEASSAVLVKLADSIKQNFDVPAEDVRLEPKTGFAQVTFRLPNNLFPGPCMVTVTAHNQISNSGIIRIAP